MNDRATCKNFVGDENKECTWYVTPSTPDPNPPCSDEYDAGGCCYGDARKQNDPMTASLAISEADSHQIQKTLSHIKSALDTAIAHLPGPKGKNSKKNRMLYRERSCFVVVRCLWMWVEKRWQHSPFVVVFDWVSFCIVTNFFLNSPDFLPPWVKCKNMCQHQTTLGRGKFIDQRPTNVGYDGAWFELFGGKNSWSRRRCHVVECANELPRIGVHRR